MPQIPPHREVDDFGHVDDHNAFSDVLTSHRSRIASLENQAELPFVFLSNYADPTGVASASDGMRQALGELAARNGGTLVVDGVFRLNINSITMGEGASFDFGGQANTVVILGTGSNSAFICTGGSGITSLRISTIENLIFQNVTFFGSQSTVPDVRKAVYLTGVRVATFIGCNFIAIVADGGFGTGAATQGAVLHAHDSYVVLKSVSFNACGGKAISRHGGTHNAPVVFLTQCGGISAEDSRWIDVLIGETFQGISPINFKRQPYCWVWIREPMTSVSAGMRGHARRNYSFKNCHFDESSGGSILVDNQLDLNRHRTLRVEGCNISSASTLTVQNNGHLAAPLLVKGVDDVTVEDSYFGDFGTHPMAARFEDCGRVRLDGIRGISPVTTISADNETDLLLLGTIRGSITNIDSQAFKTIDVNDALSTL